MIIVRQAVSCLLALQIFNTTDLNFVLLRKYPDRYFGPSADFLAEPTSPLNDSSGRILESASLFLGLCNQDLCAETVGLGLTYFNSL